MDVSDVIAFANKMDPATERAASPSVRADVFRDGDTSAPIEHVEPDLTHTEYLWYDGPQSKVGISKFLDAESEVVGVIGDACVLGTSEPIAFEVDPDPRFDWGLSPYGPVTRSKILLRMWFEIPGQPPLYSRARPEGKPSRDIWRVEHEGAFDLRFAKIGAEGVSGWANLNLMDEGNRNTCIRLISQMCRGRFIHEEEAQVHIADQRPIEEPTDSKPTDPGYPEGRLTPAWVDRRVSDFRGESSEDAPSEGNSSSSEGRK